MQELELFGLNHLKSCHEIHIPKPFKKDIDILFKTQQHIYAIVHETCLNDYVTYKKVLILLNKLCRYYHCSITIYTLSYRSICCDEKIYTTFTQNPTSV